MRPFSSGALKAALALGLCLLFTADVLYGQRPSQRGRDARSVAPLSLNESEEQLEAFRKQRLSGDYVFRFELVHYPKRGKTIAYEGYLWGTWNQNGPLSRVVIWPEQGKKRQMELIVQNGYDPQVWIIGKEGRAEKLPEERLREPLIQGIIYTAFDLLMPFIYWQDYDYAGSERRSGRPHDTFTMLPPKSWQRHSPDLAGVNVTIDRNFRALNKIEEINRDDEVMRTFKVISFKEVDDQYIVKEIDLIDEKSKDKTRFRVLAAAVDEKLPASTFDPRAMGRGLPPVQGVKFRSL